MCRADVVARATRAADRGRVVDRAQHPRDVAQREVRSRACRDRRERLTLEVQDVPPVAAAEHLAEVEVPVDALGRGGLEHGLRARGECRNPVGVALELGKGDDRPAEPRPYGSGELARAVRARFRWAVVALPELERYADGVAALAAGTQAVHAPPQPHPAPGALHL